MQSLASNAVAESCRSGLRTWVSTITGYGVLRHALGTVLIAAAAFKGYQVATGRVVETDFFSSQFGLILAVETELLVGLWLFAGVFPNAGRYVAMTLFGAFTGLSAYNGVAGAESCGCFGSVAVNPWIVAALDVAALAALMCFRPSEAATGDSRDGSARRWMFAIVPAVVLGTGIVLCFAAYPTQAAVYGPGMMERGGMVIADPSKWLGKPFPRTKFIETDEDLSQGEWNVLLYHGDCPECQQALQDLAREFRRRGDSVEFLIVEIPSPSKPAHRLRDIPAGLQWTSIEDGREWIVRTPVTLGLKDGIVNDVS